MPLESITDGMRPGYQMVDDIVSESGCYRRMVSALATHMEKVRDKVFDELAEKISHHVGCLVESVAAEIKKIAPEIRAKFDDVYSMCWDSRQDVMDPTMKQFIEQVRKRLCVDLERLRQSQKESYDIMVSSEPNVSSMVAVKMECL